MDDANAVKVAGVPTSTLNRIDLSGSDIRQSVSLLEQACLDSGFFYVINHGIGQDLMEEVFVQSRWFFGLPLSEKMKLLGNEKHRGRTPLLDEVLDAGNQVQGDYKEGYYTGAEVPEDDPDAQKPHFGPNLWPSEEILPRWRQTMEKFHSQALNVAKVVARIIALALDLEADFFDKPEILGEPILILRLLHYEGLISDPSKGIYGAGEHSDFGFITLLATDDVPGLQV
ncbi:2-oxoglutarate-dependent dioxygenase citB-like [Eucalyptus grandis]|uniref:2-oxoglutarate-dependent dioxygenase citB-like n=1 Tax=Eucalyptus grandis TaxID=71139 RepID=UPI00192F1185|nr:2-oxoglutarate-dependent dioxygenase citB-like [Eucalyptus grandis]